MLSSETTTQQFTTEELAVMGDALWDFVERKDAILDNLDEDFIAGLEINEDEYDRVLRERDLAEGMAYDFYTEYEDRVFFYADDDLYDEDDDWGEDDWDWNEPLDAGQFVWDELDLRNTDALDDLEEDIWGVVF